MLDLVIVCRLKLRNGVCFELRIKNSSLETAHFCGISGPPQPLGKQ